MDSVSYITLPERTSADTPVGSIDSLWWRRAVVYQIYPRSFSDSDGDGIGDIRGIIKHLDYLAELGVDVLWLSPIYPSPQVDNGYDVADYYNIDPTFGTLEDFDEMLTEIRRRGMKLMMDLVVNHTSSEHPWFIESRSSTTSAKRDWYWWRGPRDSMAAGEFGAEPTNWESYYGGSVWELDGPTGEYYLHLFSAGQPDLNWENPDVRLAIYDMMRWWLDRGVSGFRMDVINMISKNTGLPDVDQFPGSAFGPGQPHFICGPRIHEFLAEMKREVFTGRSDAFINVGEMPGVTVAEAVEFTDPARAEVDMVFQFEHVQLDHGQRYFDLRPLTLVDLKETMNRWQTGLAQRGWNSLYWNNHDQPRAVSRFGDAGEYRVESAKALGTVLHTHRGTPFVYQGEELGMTSYPFSSIEDFHDVESLQRYREAISAGAEPDAVLASLCLRSRDNGRSPMQWSAEPSAGFTAGSPWMAVHPNYSSVNAAAARADVNSVFHHYRRLIAMRHDEPTIVEGDFTMISPEHAQLYAFTRRLGSSEFLTVANLSSGDADAPFIDDWSNANILLATGSSDPRSVVMAPWESRVYKRFLATRDAGGTKGDDVSSHCRQGA